MRPSTSSRPSPCFRVRRGRSSAPAAWKPRRMSSTVLVCSSLRPCVVRGGTSVRCATTRTNASARLRHARWRVASWHPRRRRIADMRYIMKQKLLSFGDDFYIKDENERDAYFVDGRAFSIGDKLAFKDMNGRELAFIKQKLLAWGPTYEIVRDGAIA